MLALLFMIVCVNISVLIQLGILNRSKKKIYFSLLKFYALFVLFCLCFVYQDLATSMVQLLACSLRVWKIVGSSSDRVRPKTMQ